MRKIEFIAPVEAMRGKLSGDDPKLQYAENNNPAFEAPDGRQYAKNYQPKYIGAKRSSDGLKYFSVKTKSATLIDTASKRRMALLGAAGACVGYILKPGNMSVVNVLAPLKAHYEHAKSAEGFTGSLRKYIFETVYAALQAGTDFEWPAIRLSPQTTIPAVKLYSRWSGTEVEPGDTGYIVNVSDHILVKFWTVLTGGVIFKVEISHYDDGNLIIDAVKVGVALSGATFGDVINSASNILGMTKDDQNNILCESLPLWSGGVEEDGVETTTPVTANEMYYANQGQG